MKFLGIDYGMKRIGLAISDEGGTLAFPRDILANGAGAEVFKKIGEVIKNENISEVVVGESVDFSGRLNMLSAHIELFIKELEKEFNLPVHKQKEFLTSVEARRSKDGKHTLTPSQAHSKLKNTKAGRVDASAAALILQRYLDRRNNINIKK